MRKNALQMGKVKCDALNFEAHVFTVPSGPGLRCSVCVCVGVGVGVCVGRVWVGVGGYVGGWVWVCAHE